VTELRECLWRHRCNECLIRHFLHLNALGVQMVLRTIGGKTASGTAAPGITAKAERPPTDEPW